MRSESTREDGSTVVSTTVTEDKRLAAVVAAIDAEVGIVPRGRYKITAADEVQVNGSFCGECTSLLATGPLLRILTILRGQANTVGDIALVWGLCRPVASRGVAGRFVLSLSQVNKQGQACSKHYTCSGDIRRC